MVLDPISVIYYQVVNLSVKHVNEYYNNLRKFRVFGNLVIPFEVSVKFDQFTWIVFTCFYLWQNISQSSFYYFYQNVIINYNDILIKGIL